MLISNSGTVVPDKNLVNSSGGPRRVVGFYLTYAKLLALANLPQWQKKIE